MKQKLEKKVVEAGEDLNEEERAQADYLGLTKHQSHKLPSSQKSEPVAF